MTEFTTIQVDKKVIGSLKKLKKYPRETYNELIASLIDFVQHKGDRQYDEFLHKVQQPKMRELWGNEADEVWRDA